MIRKSCLLKLLKWQNTLLITSFLFLTFFSGHCNAKRSVSISPNKTISASKTILPGRIIFITGSCSSGKSSMAGIISQKLDAKYLAFDKYVIPIILKKFIAKHHGKILAFFINKLFARNFFTTVSLVGEKRKYKYQKKFYKDLREGLADEPTSRMFKEAKNIALQGQDVVVESPLYLGEGVNFLKNLSEFDGIDITYILAYCPWDYLVDRIKKRNTSKNKKPIVNLIGP